MNKAVRAFLAVIAAIVTTCLMLLVSGFWGDASMALLTRLFPAISAVTKNTNTDDWGKLFLLPIALSGGLVSGALVFDKSLSGKTETFTAAALLVLLGAVTGINFWWDDTLINVNA